VALDIDIAPPANQREVLAFARVAAVSLGMASEERALAGLERIGAANLRLARRGNEIIAGLGIIPMGHWFMGRSVPCAGVSVVAVAPEHRSRGVATELMRTLLVELRRDGTALSSLFPATYPLYRGSGYETAGTRFLYRLPLSSLGRGSRDVELRAATSDEDLAAMKRVYDARVRHLAGPTDRGRSPFFWRRVLEPIGEDVHTYLALGDKGCEGYAVMSYKAPPEQLAARELPVRDIAFLGASAAGRLLRLIADHDSIYRTMTFVGGPSDPLLTLMKEERPEVVDMKRWMLRIVDVRAALEKRGWRAGVRGELHFDLWDGLLRENSRRWVVEVAGGRAAVGEGGSGRLVIDIRGLAALYSGHLTAEELRAAGLCEGDPEDVAMATSLFAGPAPWTPDYF
jgi:predicted acetyltransferase